MKLLKSGMLELDATGSPTARIRTDACFVTDVFVVFGRKKKKRKKCESIFLKQVDQQQ